MAPQDTKAQIVQIAQDILTEDGLEQVSFDAIARRLGRSKQAVLYWFPSRQDLLAALFIPALTAEADAVEAALQTVSDRKAAIGTFVKTLAQFHLGNLPRFRMMYLALQITKGGASQSISPDILGRVHATTDRTYSTLAEKLQGDPMQARAEAVAIHAAVLGLCTMSGLAAHLSDPLKQGNDALVGALADLLAGT